MSRLTMEVDDALRQQGALAGAEPVDLLAKARRNAGLDEDAAMKLAVEETRKVRGGKARF